MFENPSRLVFQAFPGCSTPTGTAEVALKHAVVWAEWPQRPAVSVAASASSWTRLREQNEPIDARAAGAEVRKGGGGATVR